MNLAGEVAVCINKNTFKKIKCEFLGLAFILQGHKLLSRGRFGAL